MTNAVDVSEFLALSPRGRVEKMLERAGLSTEIAELEEKGRANEKLRFEASAAKSEAEADLRNLLAQPDTKEAKGLDDTMDAMHRNVERCEAHLMLAQAEMEKWQNNLKTAQGQRDRYRPGFLKVWEAKRDARAEGFEHAIKEAEAAEAAYEKDAQDCAKNLDELLHGARTILLEELKIGIDGDLEYIGIRWADLTKDAQQHLAAGILTVDNPDIRYILIHGDEGPELEAWARVMPYTVVSR